MIGGFQLTKNSNLGKFLDSLGAENGPKAIILLKNVTKSYFFIVQSISNDK